MIGSKTLVTLFAAAAALLLTLGTGVLSPHRLSTRGPDALLLAGIFGVLVGVLMFRFWRLGEASSTYFRVARDGTLFENEGHFLGGPLTRLATGKNEGGAFDLGPRTQLALSVGVALGAAVLEAVSEARGETALTFQDFWPAFLIVAVVSSVSGFIFGRLEPSAGAEMSGHAVVAAKPAADST